MEPKVGEELCRLFPEDETVDLHPHRSAERRTKEKRESSRLGPVLGAPGGPRVHTSRVHSSMGHIVLASERTISDRPLLGSPACLAGALCCGHAMVTPWVPVSVPFPHSLTFFSHNVPLGNEKSAVPCNHKLRHVAFNRTVEKGHVLASCFARTPARHLQNGLYRIAGPFRLQTSNSSSLRFMDPWKSKETRFSPSKLN